MFQLCNLSITAHPFNNLASITRMKVTPSSYAAEYVGAFFFILSIFVSGGNPLVIGGALALVIFLIAGVSGGHVNPAVSLAMMMNNSINTVEFAGYVAAQLAGGASAYYAYRALKH
jgi:aquaporin Z